MLVPRHLNQSCVIVEMEIYMSTPVQTLSIVRNGGHSRPDHLMCMHMYVHVCMCYGNDDSVADRQPTVPDHF